MGFKLENDEKNIKVVLEEDEKILGKATCFFDNTPIEEGRKIGCIGDFEVNDLENGLKILKKCEELFLENGIHKIVAPMNGNTWKKYRTLKYTSNEPMFLLENVNPYSDNEIFLKSGFKELYTYTSNKGALDDAYESEILDIVEKNIENECIEIRKFNKEKYIDDLKKIYNVSSKSFTRNPFYTPISETEFINQYEPYINMIDDDFVLIAEKDGKEIGFVFCIPNYNEIKEGKNLETLILKTIAVLPEYEDLGIGNILLRKISKKAKEKNFLNWIFAFMYSNNTSQKMAKRNKAKVIREYALYAKDI